MVGTAPPLKSGLPPALLLSSHQVARENIASRLRLEQVKLLRANAPVAFVSTVVAASILCAALRDEAAPAALAAWFLSLMLVVLLRYRHISRFEISGRSGDASADWLNRFLFWTCFTGVVWGCSAFLFYPAASLQHQIFMAFLLAGMSAAAIAFYSAMFSAALVFILPTSLPVIGQMFLETGGLHLEMALLSGLFVTVVILAAKRMNEMTLQSLKLGLRNTELIDHLQIAREEEKARIAREIHDELGSTLTRLKMDISWLSKRLGTATEQDCLVMANLVDSAVDTMRRIATDLRPPMLDDLGLCATIKWQAEEFEKRSGIPCDVVLHGDPEGLEGEPAIALFRILQESLTNIIRHARASQVSIELRQESEQVVFRVKDDGIGVDADTRRPGAFGVQGMHERVKSLGGSMKLERRPEAGTVLAVTLPFQERDRRVRL